MNEIGLWVLLLQGGTALLVALAYLLAPGAPATGAFFGCAVGPGFAAADAARAVVRRYRRAVVAWTAAAVAVAAVAALLGAASPLGVAGGGGALALQIVGCCLAWSAARRVALPFALAASPPTVRRAALAPASGALAPLLDLGGLVPLAAAGLWLRAHWAEIPARFVTHWGLDGPDRWAAATPGQVYGPLLGGAGLVVLFAALHWLIEATTPAGSTARARASRSMAGRAFTGAGWLLGTVMAAAALTALTGGPGLVMAVALVALLAISTVMVVELRRLGRLPTEPGDGATRPGAWRAGGLFYVDADDPAIWVPKAVGLGYTVNLGHRRGRLTLALLVLVPLAVAAASTWLAR